MPGPLHPRRRQPAARAGQRPPPPFHVHLGGGLPHPSRAGPTPVPQKGAAGASHGGCPRPPASGEATPLGGAPRAAAAPPGPSLGLPPLPSAMLGPAPRLSREPPPAPPPEPGRSREISAARPPPAAPALGESPRHAGLGRAAPPHFIPAAPPRHSRGTAPGPAPPVLPVPSGGSAALRLRRLAPGRQDATGGWGDSP